MEIKKIAVVGSGAIGIYYGAKLASASDNVKFLLRADYEHVAIHGFKVESITGDFVLPSPQVFNSSEDMGQVDLVIVAWKSTSNAYYREVIEPLLHNETLILTLQNGLGNVEELARLFGARRIYGGLCFICVNRVGRGHVRHTASGLVRVGGYQVDQFPDKASGLKDVVSLLSAAEIQCEAVADLEAAQWMKLVWNIPFNGLSIAMGGVDTEKMLGLPGVEERIVRLMREVQEVALRMGHTIEDRFLEQQIELTRPMGAYCPSSMIDYREGRQVEVDAIWREPLRRAQSLGVAVPEIERLLDEIEQRILERGK